METYESLVKKALKIIPELMPGDLKKELLGNHPPLLLDIREQHEYDLAHIANVIYVPRGVLESACEWGNEDTTPILASRRDQNIVLVCRSGKRSALAALTMKQLGFRHVRSLATGIKGWNEDNLEMVDKDEKIVDGDEMNAILNKAVAWEKLGPNN